MTLIAHYRMLAGYNRVANERLYECCALLEIAKYREPRSGSFGSIQGLLNHILLGDRIWMSRFEGGGTTTPPLNTILFDDFHELRIARMKEDSRICEFFESIDPRFFSGALTYANSKGQVLVERPMVAAAHLFNHQTHHRGQVHVMLSQAGVAPPSLDMHRIVNPL